MPLCSTHALKDRADSPFPFRQFCCQYCRERTRLDDKVFDQGGVCSEFIKSEKRFGKFPFRCDVRPCSCWGEESFDSFNYYVF